MKKIIAGAVFAAAATAIPAHAAVNGSVSVTVLQTVTSICGTIQSPDGGGNTPSLLLGDATFGGVDTASLNLNFYCNSRYGMDLQLKSEKSGLKEGDENGVNAIDYVLDLSLQNGDSVSMNTAGSTDASPILNVTSDALRDANTGLPGTITLTTDGSAPAYSGVYSDTITLSIDAGGNFEDPNV